MQHVHVSRVGTHDESKGVNKNHKNNPYTIPNTGKINQAFGRIKNGMAVNVAYNEQSIGRFSETAWSDFLLAAAAQLGHSTAENLRQDINHCTLRIPQIDFPKHVLFDEQWSWAMSFP